MHRFFYVLNVSWQKKVIFQLFFYLLTWAVYFINACRSKPNFHGDPSLSDSSENEDKNSFSCQQRDPEYEVMSV